MVEPWEHLIVLMDILKIVMLVQTILRTEQKSILELQFLKEINLTRVGIKIRNLYVI